jgi:zinc transporter 1
MDEVNISKNDNYIAGMSETESSREGDTSSSMTIEIEGKGTLLPTKAVKWYKDKNVWRILVVLFLTLGFMVAEIVVGILTGSLALLTDAFHMLSDALGLIVGMLALLYTKKKHSETFSYGWVRAEIIGGLINGTFLVSSTVYITIEAVQRFINTEVINDPLLIVWIGCGGLAVNIIGLILFAGHSGLKPHFHGHSHTATDEHGHHHGHKHKHKHKKSKEDDNREDKKELDFVVEQEAASNDDDSHDSDDGNDKQNTKEQNLELSSSGHSKGDKPMDGDESKSGSGLQSERKSSSDIREMFSEGQTKIEASTKESNLSDYRGNESLTNSKSPTLQKEAPKKKNTSKNLRAIFIHLLGDALGSLGAIGAGLAIYFFTFPQRYYFDPIVSLLISALILRGAIPLVKSCIKILMQSVPHTLNLENLKSELEKIPGVAAVHELHVWSLSDDKTIGSVHVLCLEEASFTKIVSAMKDIFHKYEIHSSTIQPEYVSIRALKEKKQFRCKFKCNRECDPENACCPLNVDVLTDEDVNSILLKSKPSTVKQRRHKKLKEKEADL